MEHRPHGPGHSQRPARGLRAGKLAAGAGLVPQADRGPDRRALPRRRPASAGPDGLDALPLGARQTGSGRCVHLDAVPRVRSRSRAARARPYRRTHHHTVPPPTPDSIRSPAPGSRAVRMGGADNDHSHRPPGPTRVPPTGAARRPHRQPHRRRTRRGSRRALRPPLLQAPAAGAVRRSPRHPRPAGRTARRRRDRVPRTAPPPGSCAAASATSPRCSAISPSTWTTSPGPAPTWPLPTPTATASATCG